MLTAKKVSSDLPNYAKFVSTYKESFPLNERWPVPVLRLYGSRRGSHLIAFYDEEVFCGLTYLVHLDDIVYIFYLAVNPDLRSAGYGSQILAWVKSKFPTSKISLIVETVDESFPDYEQRLKRQEFYEKNGFYKTNCKIKKFGTEYEILSNHLHFSFDEYVRVSNYIYSPLLKVKFLTEAD